MINVRKALADLKAAPGDIVAVPKAQMADLLHELLTRQESATRRDLSIFTVAAVTPA